jgi:hypothetical protein
LRTPLERNVLVICLSLVTLIGCIGTIIGGSAPK